MESKTSKAMRQRALIDKKRMIINSLLEKLLQKNKTRMLPWVMGIFKEIILLINTICVLYMFPL